MRTTSSYVSTGTIPKVLVVDDEANMRWVLSQLLRQHGLDVITAEDGIQAVARIEQEAPQVVLMDMVLPRLDGLQALEQIKAMARGIPVIVFTGFGDVPSAVQAMKLGAYDFLTKPFDEDTLLYTIERAVERQELLSRVETLTQQLTHCGALHDITGSSPQIQVVFQQIAQVAHSNFSVLIEGETGTGKELVARAIHQHSDRHQNPFIALDCGAIPEPLVESELFGYEKGAFTGAYRRKDGYIELAHQGTLFLDEIANLPFAVQGKLLRILQERKVQRLGGTQPLAVDLRLITASNVRLEREVQTGRFRHDLFHRLNEFTIRIPPLRERQADILPLAERFLGETNIELKKHVRGLTPAAASMLVHYSWPGNVRELRNVIRRATLLSQEHIEPDHLVDLRATQDGTSTESAEKEGLPEGLSLKEITQRAIVQVERETIAQALRSTRGNKSEAARLLRIDYKTLYYKLKEYGTHI